MRWMLLVWERMTNWSPGSLGSVKSCSKILEQYRGVEIVQYMATNLFKSCLCYSVRNHWTSGNYFTLLRFECLICKMEIVCIPQYYWKRLNEMIGYKLACQVILINNGLWQLVGEVPAPASQLTSGRSILTKASLCHLYKYSSSNRHQTAL